MILSSLRTESKLRPSPPRTAGGEGPGSQQPTLDRVELTPNPAGSSPPAQVSSESRFPEEDTQVTDRFREVFFSDYEESKCGQNIRRFVVKFPEPERLEGARVLGIENKGFSYFGLTRVMQARDTNFKGEMRTTDKNWYHHVVLENQGRIYDFDYGVTPQAPTVEEYFSKMFLSCDKVRPDEKLKDYEIQVINAAEYAAGDRDTSTRLRLGDYLKGWGVNLERFQVQPAKVGKSAPGAP